MGTFLNRSLHKAFSLRYRQIEFFSENPVEQQERVLQDLLKSARRTEWGQKYDFASIHNRNDFANRFPISTYDDLKPYIERMLAGQKNILWPGRVKWFAKSSGTTNDKSKFIPVSDESLKKCHYRAGADVYGLYINNNPEANVLASKNLSIGGSQKISNTGSNIRTGDLSAVMLYNLPPITRLKNCPSPEISLLPDFEEKIEKIAQSTINEDIGSLTGVPSWFLVLMKRILEITGKDNLLDIWPNLELFVHGGINFDPYRESYQNIIPSDSMNYMNTYNASEGFFGIQNDLNENDMLLMLDYGIYYEFIPMDEYGRDDAAILKLEEVEVGKNYAMVISTNGGLWRYLIGDTVTFTSTSPYKINITGRTKHFINTFGEELIIDNAEKGLSAACKATGANIHEYTAGPIFMGTDKKGAHQWVIEFDKFPNNMDAFTDILDQTLQNVNSDYEAKRYKNLTLRKPDVIVAPQGSFYNWMKDRGKIGGQNKIPRLANNREYLDQLIPFIIG